MRPIGSISQADDFVETKFGLDAAQRCSFPADVDADGFLGEDMSIPVGAKNPYLNFF
jgi:hypothetical protein